jgi:hypothetical protein
MKIALVSLFIINMISMISFLSSMWWSCFDTKEPVNKHTLVSAISAWIMVISGIAVVILAFMVAR